MLQLLSLRYNPQRQAWAPTICGMAGLRVEFIGEIHHVDEELTFGRSADLVLDESNRFMHRVVGSFVWQSSSWWIENRGDASKLFVFGSDGTRVELPAGARTAVSMNTGTVSFLAGPTPYQLTFSVDIPMNAAAPLDLTGDATAEFGTPFTPREREYLVTFARDRLLGEGTSLSSFAVVADMWGVSPKTVENTMLRLRQRSRDVGVRNIESLDDFVTHLLAHGRLGLSDLLAVEASHPAIFEP